MRHAVGLIMGLILCALAAGAQAATSTFTRTPTMAGTPTFTSTFATPTAEFVRRIEAGGANNYTDCGCRVWSVDMKYQDTGSNLDYGYDALSGGATYTTGASFAGLQCASDLGMYQSQRYSNIRFKFMVDVPDPGIYDVDLLLGEENPAVTNSKFNLLMEGVTIQEVYPYGLAGGANKAVTLHVQGVTVVDGRLDIELVRTDGEYATLRALRVSNVLYGGQDLCTPTFTPTETIPTATYSPAITWTPWPTNTPCAPRPYDDDPATPPPIATRGVAGDLWADVVIGQPDFGSMAANEVMSRRVYSPKGVLVDRSGVIRATTTPGAIPSPERLYVYDGMNNRILGFKDISPITICQGSDKYLVSDSANPCIEPDIVLGQPDFNCSACNGDANKQNYNAPFPRPDAKTLCGLAPWASSPDESGSKVTMATDKEGNLYVPDVFNNRVLRYDNPFDPTGDGTADYVWGQDDFSGWQEKNIGAESLYFGDSVLQTGGVAIDGYGNLWVADTMHSRVLRFPNCSGVPSKTADLVLGQPSMFDTAPCADPTVLAKMRYPMSVRVDDWGNVFVADYGFQCDDPTHPGRILIYKHANVEFYNGQGADAGITQVAQYAGVTQVLHGVQGLELETQPQPDPYRVLLWANSTCSKQVVLFDINLTTTPTAVAMKVLLTDEPGHNPENASLTGDSNNGDHYFHYYNSGEEDAKSDWGFNGIACYGGIGVDSVGNIYLCNSMDNDVWRFPEPIPMPRSGVAHSADVAIFKPRQSAMINNVGRSGMHRNSMAVGRFNGPGEQVQLILADVNGRMMFWNLPTPGGTPTPYPPADGFVTGVSDDYLYRRDHPIGRIREDWATPTQHIWVVYDNDNKVCVYNLPLDSSATPVATLSRTLPVLGGGVISWKENGLQLRDIAPSRDGTQLWVVDAYNSRVYRVRDPLSTAPYVDRILGQVDLSESVSVPDGSRNQEGHEYTGSNCNNHGSTMTMASLCNPGAARLDSDGNLYISDSMLESQGNFRLLRYDKDTLDSPVTPTTPAVTPVATFGLSADKEYKAKLGWIPTPGSPRVLDPKAAWLPAIDKNGTVLVAGLNTTTMGVACFPIVIEDPLDNEYVSTSLNDLASMAYDATFDENDNLYIADQNRNRILIYWKPFLNPSFTPTATLTPSLSPAWTPTDSMTPSQTPTPTDSTTATPSATLTVTWSPTSTYTASSTSTYSMTLTDTCTSSPSATMSGTATDSTTATQTPSPSLTAGLSPSNTATVPAPPTPSPSATTTAATPLTPIVTPSFPPCRMLFHPNPAKEVDMEVSFCLGRAARLVRIRFFTTAMRMVLELRFENVSAGHFRRAIQLRDRKARPLSNGLYHVVVETDQGERYLGKLVILR